VTDPVRAIADAVLYEGYVLWPYRRSALKNTHRWTFGGVYPRAHAEGREAGDDPWTMQDPMPDRGAGHDAGWLSACASCTSCGARWSTRAVARSTSSRSAAPGT
jgi:hypothetical protein